MNYNIIQEFLVNKRGFSLKESPIIHYRKDFPLTSNLNVTLVIVFKDYTITFAKYLYYQDQYCCFDVMPEMNHTCQNVTEVLELIKKYDNNFTNTDFVNQIKSYISTSKEKLSKLSNECNELMKTVTGSQRAMSMFTPNTPDWRAIGNKLNNAQIKLAKNNKEIEVLHKVYKELSNYLNN